MAVACASLTLGGGGEHVGRHPGRQPGGYSGPGVGLVDDDRQAVSAGGEVRGSGDVAAEADHDLGAHAAEHRGGGPYRVAQHGGCL